MNLGQRFKHSLKARITLLTLVIFLISIWSLAFYADRELRRDIRDLLGRQQFSAVFLLATEINEDLSTRVRALEQVASEFNAVMDARRSEALKALLHEQVVLNLFNGGAFFTNLDAQVVASVPIEYKSQELQQSEFKEVQDAIVEGKTMIGMPIMDKSLGTPVVRIATPIRDDAGRVHGALVGVINLAAPNFLDKFQKNQYAESGAYLLVDARNRIIVTSSDKPRQLEVLPPQGVNETMDRYIQGYEGVEVFTNPKGVEVMAAVSHIPVAGWYAAIALPTTAAFAPVHTLQRRILLATLVLTLLSAVLTRWMLGRMLAPLTSTARTLGAYADKQQLLHALPVCGEDEISQVISGFNRLLGDLMQRQEGLRESEERYRVSFQTSRDALSITRLSDGLYVDVNEGFTRMFGWNKEEVLGKTVKELGLWSNPQDRQILLQQIRQFRHCENLEFNLTAKDGRTLVTLVSANEITLNGEPCMLAVNHDISERKQAEQQLQLAANVFTFAREGIIITDAFGKIVEVNETFTQITGYSKEEVVGQSPKILQSGRQGPDFYANLWQQLIHNGHWVGEIWNRRKNGEIYAEILTISAVLDVGGRVQNYVGLFTDITSIKEHEYELERIAHYDRLTGLPNRLRCVELLRSAIQRCSQTKRCLAVVYLDLDNFRSINEQYGHDAGDVLLIQLSNFMRDVLRDDDSLSRFGGDEFVAVIDDLEQPQDAYPVFARLLRAASLPIGIRAGSDAADDLIANPMHVSASMGITFYPQDAVDAEQLIRHADQAMYVAKQAGKNSYHLFDVAKDAAVQSRQEGVEHIREAMSRGEFVLYYQPKVNMVSGQVSGVEALIRWNHPQQGLLSPMAFLPLIEDHPISIELGEWVIDAALRQISNWSSAGMYMPVSVNISARQLQQENFVTRLSALLNAHAGVPRESLNLEVLESSAMEDIDHVASVIHDCQAMGVGFALDDFGTGYSSLIYLKRLPVQTLKIDQSFVSDMLHDPNDLAIVKSVIGLAKAFGRGVVAEGVETMAHGKLLLSIGCSQAQGYCIARPMQADELPTWIGQWNQEALWKEWRQGEDAFPPAA